MIYILYETVCFSIYIKQILGETARSKIVENHHPTQNEIWIVYP